MKSRFLVILLAFILGIMPLALVGCNSYKVEDLDNSSLIISQTPSSSTDISSYSNTETSSSSETSVPKKPEGTPTVFIGPDGNVIYSSEITEIEGTDKTAAEITKTDEGTNVLCEGFQYFVEPMGIAYNNYQNPEKFDGITFEGEFPQNNNTYKRINVGDTICGLKLVKAVSNFIIDYYQNEPYYNDGFFFGMGPKRKVAEFEGSITLEGFLRASSPNSYEPAGGLLQFYPAESKLPVIGKIVEPHELTIGSAYVTYSDMPEIQCGLLQDLECSSDGLDIGDAAFVQITLHNIKYYDSGAANAEIEDIKLLSDILYHKEDSI